MGVTIEWRKPMAEHAGYARKEEDLGLCCFLRDRGCRFSWIATLDVTIKLNFLAIFCHPRAAAF